MSNVTSINKSNTENVFDAIFKIGRSAQEDKDKLTIAIQGLNAFWTHDIEKYYTEITEENNLFNDVNVKTDMDKILSDSKNIGFVDSKIYQFNIKNISEYQKHKTSIDDLLYTIPRVITNLRIQLYNSESGNVDVGQPFDLPKNNSGYGTLNTQPAQIETRGILDKILGGSRTLKSKTIDKGSPYRISLKKIKSYDDILDLWQRIDEYQQNAFTIWYEVLNISGQREYCNLIMNVFSHKIAPIIHTMIGYSEQMSIQVEQQLGAKIATNAINEAKQEDARNPQMQ